MLIVFYTYGCWSEHIQIVLELLSYFQIRKDSPTMSYKHTKTLIHEEYAQR